MKEIEIIQYYLLGICTGATSRPRCDQLFEHSVLKIKEMIFQRMKHTHTHTHTHTQRLYFEIQQSLDVTADTNRHTEQQVLASAHTQQGRAALDF